MFHLVDADFVGVAETVFYRAQDAVQVIAVALELDDGIDDVLQDLGSGDAALLVDVADEDDRGVRFLGVALECGGTLAHLCHAAWGALQLLVGDGLDGIHNDQGGLEGADAGEDIVQRGFAQQVTLAVHAAPGDAVGTHAQLLRALLTRDVEHTAGADAQHVLQHQRGLADARLSSKQHDAARHEAATQHAIEFVTWQVDAGLVFGTDFRDLHRLLALAVVVTGHVVAHCRRLRHLGLLDIGVPLAAGGALAEPLGRLVAAVLAEEGGFVLLLGHSG